MSTVADTYPMPEHGWTCFHCGANFMTPASAREHFGGDPLAEPGCLMRMPGGERQLLRVIRGLEQQVKELREANEQLDYEAGFASSMTADLARLFDGARTPHAAWLKLEAAENRALAAEDRLKLGSEPGAQS